MQQMQKTVHAFGQDLSYGKIQMSTRSFWEMKLKAFMVHNGPLKMSPFINKIKIEKHYLLAFDVCITGGKCR
jgi:hypothetical protein